METNPSPRLRWAVAAVLALSALSFLFSPFYMKYLRGKFRRDLPSQWEKVANNGSFAYASPLLYTARNIEEGMYAMKVRQAYLHGFPYDPYTHERSPRSWVFDSLMFYPLVPFVAAAGGDIHLGWALAHAALGALWVWSFFIALRIFTDDRKLALVLAVFLFFFFDSLRALFLLPHAPLRALPQWMFFLVAYATGQVQWMRLPTPGMSALFPFWLLAGAWRLSLAQKTRPALSLLLGAACGLLCFLHAYEWVFACAALGFFFLWALQSRLSQSARWNLGLAFFAAAAVSAGYYLFARSMNAPVMEDIITRAGRHGRVFERASLYFLPWAALFYWKSRRAGERLRGLWLLLSACALAVSAAALIPMAVGYDIQFYGHTARIASAAMLLGLLGWGLHGAQEKFRLGRIDAAMLLCFLFAWVFLREKAWADTHYKIFGTPRHMEEALSWVEKTVPEEGLVVSLSGVATQQLGLLGRTRSLAAAGSPSYGSPVPTEYILRGLARILKTARADPERFLAERWERSEERDTLKQQTAYFNRDISLEAAEAATWPVFLLDVEGFRERSVQARKLEILRYFKEEAPPPRPYWLWIGRLDEPFLKENPPSFGGKLAFENPGVRIYSFE